MGQLGVAAITSKSGGADVLEALGVRLDLTTEEFRHCLDKAGLGFLFAPSYHPAFKAVVEARKILGAKKVRTIFNLIGPLLNPARPECQLVGVYDRGLCPVFAEILQRLGRGKASRVRLWYGFERSARIPAILGFGRFAHAEARKHLTGQFRHHLQRSLATAK